MEVLSNTQKEMQKARMLGILQRLQLILNTFFFYSIGTKTKGRAVNTLLFKLYLGNVRKTKCASWC